MVPTSITIAPSLTKFLVTKPGFPMAETKTSAFLQTLSMSIVFEWHIVTVAFS